MPLVNSNLVDHVPVPPIPEFRAKAREIQPATGRSFDLMQAVPSFLTFQKIRDALAEDLRSGAASFYTEGRGLEKLRRLIQGGHRLLDHCPLDNIMITAGANHGMFTALLTLLTPGDQVVLPEPVYFNYDMALPMLGLKALYCPMAADKGMALDAGAMVKFLEGAGPKARAVILISPNNPTGARYEPSEVVKLLEWTTKHNVEVLLDETYRWFDPKHMDDPRLAAFVGNGLTLVGSFSKAFSLTGYRVGYWVASPSQIREGMKVQDSLMICPSHIGQLAAIHGIEQCMDEVAQSAARMRTLVESVAAVNAQLKHFRFVSTGAFFAYLRHPLDRMTADEAALEIYRNTGILGLPGTVFGKSQNRFIRLSVCNLSLDDLTSAMDCLVQWDSTL